MQGRIINITRFCTDDGPGIRTTVFLKGCPLRCLWCHNPESQNPEVECYTNGETVGRDITAEAVVREVLEDRVFYDASGGGVTISGGEPLFQADFTAEVLRLCKENGLHTAMETSGYAAPEVFCKVVQHCDLVLFDIKETDEGNHLAYTGVPLSPILKNVKALDEMQIPFVLRLPMIPGLNDRENHFLEVKRLAETLPCCSGIEIMPYHKLGQYKYEQLGRAYSCGHIAESGKETVQEWERRLK